MPEEPQGESRTESKAPTLEFLYKALDDTQSTIRFLDAKAAIALAPLGFMITKALDLVDRGDVFQGLWNEILGTLFFIVAVASIWVAARAFFPMIDPRQHVNLKSERVPEFFVAGVKNVPWWLPFWTPTSQYQLTRTHEDYVGSLEGATNELLTTIVSGELLKVSLIREIKYFRLRWLTYLGMVTAILFVCLSISARRNLKSTEGLPPSMTVINSRSSGSIDELSSGRSKVIVKNKVAPKSNRGPVSTRRKAASPCCCDHPDTAARPIPDTK